jgi:D-sedoheptulose 7-phosphate isomerase
MQSDLRRYFANLAEAIELAEASDGQGLPLSLQAWCQAVLARLHALKADGGKLMFVGNGGSAGICSHMATDFAKNAGLPALAFNDGAQLTCLGNDLGQAEVFAYPVRLHGGAGDLLIAISSSGRSANILNAVAAARGVAAHVVTLSGFAADNPLRRAGDFNLYVPADEYGFVEVAHQAWCHALIDLYMGWRPDKGLWTRKTLEANP